MAWRLNGISQQLRVDFTIITKYYLVGEPHIAMRRLVCTIGSSDDNLDGNVGLWAMRSHSARNSAEIYLQGIRRYSTIKAVRFQAQELHLRTLPRDVFAQFNIYLWPSWYWLSRPPKSQGWLPISTERTSSMLRPMFVPIKVITVPPSIGPDVGVTCRTG